MDIKIQSLTQVEIDNLETHFHLDSKLRALDIACKFSKDPFKMFQEPTPVKSCSVQTDINYDDLIQKEQKIDILDQELKVVKFKQTADLQSKEG